MAKVVPDAKKRTLQPIVAENVEPGSTIHTDELRSYRGLDRLQASDRQSRCRRTCALRQPRQRDRGFLGSPETVDPQDARSRLGEAPSEVREGVGVSLQPSEAAGRDLRRSGGEPLVRTARRRASKR